MSVTDMPIQIQGYSIVCSPRPLGTSSIQNDPKDKTIGIPQFFLEPYIVRTSRIPGKLEPQWEVYFQSTILLMHVEVPSVSKAIQAPRVAIYPLLFTATTAYLLSSTARLTCSRTYQADPSITPLTVRIGV